jgi:ERF superfamily
MTVTALPERPVQHQSLRAALVAFQAELPKIAKLNEAEVRPKEGRSYTYTYADLADVSEVVLPKLAEHGLSFSAAPTLYEGNFVLAYRLLHVSDPDDVIAGFYPLPSPNAPPQALGSAITYARRYALLAVTGVAPGGDDDDAASAPTVDWIAQARATRTVDELAQLRTQAIRAGQMTEALDTAFLKLRDERVRPRDPLQRQPEEVRDDPAPK